MQILTFCSDNLVKVKMCGWQRSLVQGYLPSQRKTVLLATHDHFAVVDELGHVNNFHGLVDGGQCFVVCTQTWDSNATKRLVVGQSIL